jgi:AraC-like DNA-binding protein
MTSRHQLTDACGLKIVALNHNCPVLHIRPLFEQDGIAVSDVACRHEPRRGQTDEHASMPALVFVRRGCFTRTVNGVDTVLDPTLAYTMNLGDEQRFDHPHSIGDDCTYLTFSKELVEYLTGEDSLPPDPIATSGAVDLAQRKLLAHRDDADASFERALQVAALALAQESVSRPSKARRALVASAREVLVGEPGLSLPELAHRLATSPHHLSRQFHAATGATVSRHRLRLRVRAALERLAEGEQDLATLAADLGFADQPHLTRAVKAETGSTPGQLRRGFVRT